MKKEDIRKEFFKLRVKHHSYNQCKKIIQAQLGYKVTLRTLYRWNKKLNEGNWDLCDKSKRPKTIHTKITQTTEEKIVKIRNKTGWGQERIAVNMVTTSVVTKLLDDLIKLNGAPRQILSDNGSAYGVKSKHSKFDRWCNRRGIHHIRSSVHSPTTCGKIERLFQTIKRELKYCKEDLDLFRMRYNHFRSHKSLDNKTPAQVYFDFARLF